MLWMRTALFTIVVPGTVLLFVPYGLLAAELGPSVDLGLIRWFGLLPLSIGLVIILYCFTTFVHRGRGTPAPYDPPQELVVAGLYRYLRNPQYVGVILVVVGEALLAEAPILSAYAAFLAIVYHLFVRYYEEPTLGRMFGDAYFRYCKAVPRWLPKLTCGWH